MAAVGLRLVLVRHGATPRTEARRFNGHDDVSLSDEGRRQARALAGTFAALDLAGAWCSDLTRAIETAELAGLTAAPDHRLRELDLGDLEGLCFEECSADVQRSLVEFDSFAAPGGESTADLTARVAGFVSSLRPGTHALVTHGGVIRVLLRRYGRDRGVEPCEVVELDLPGHN